MRILGLDVGSKTLGVAVSDPFGWTSQSLEIIKINEEEEYYGIDRLKELVDEYSPEKIVLGLPKNMNNSEGPRAVQTRYFADILSKNFKDIKIVFQDERLTTVQAERMLAEEANLSRKKINKVVDSTAAALILQNYLNANS